MKKQNPASNSYPSSVPPTQCRGTGAPAPIVDQQRRSYVTPDNGQDADYRSEPMQSKSFRILQKLTEGIEDGMSPFSFDPANKTLKAS